MKNYEVKVTATWWVDVEAENEEEAEQIAHTTYYDNGSYDGVDEIVVHEVEEESDEEE